MATVVNTPNSGSEGSSMGFVVGMLVLLLVVFLFFVYGLPALRQSSAPQVQVPEQLDVNVNAPGQGQQ